MKQRKPGILGVVLFLLATVLAIHGWHSEYIRMPELAESAQKFYFLLAGYEFDGIDFDKENAELILYQYLPDEPDGSVLSEVEVMRLLLPEELNHFPFVSARSLDSGIFLAISISWNGEWTGVYVSNSSVPDRLHPYIKKTLDSNAWYLEMVPDHIL